MSSISQKIQAQDGDRWLNKSENEWLEHFTATGIRENLVEVKAVLNSINIPFDNCFQNRPCIGLVKVAALMEKYVADGMAYRADKPRVEERVRREDSKAAQYAEQQAGGLFLETSRFGDDEDRIIQRANGTPVCPRCGPGLSYR